MNTDKLINYLFELIQKREAEYTSLCEYSSFNKEESDYYLAKTNEIKKLHNELIADEKCYAKELTIDEAIAHAAEMGNKNDSGCAKQHLQLANWLKELKDIKTKYTYLAADFENYKRRSATIIENTKNTEKCKLALKFLDTYDSMERMLKHIDKFSSNETISRECSGFNMIVENFVKALESEGFTKIDCNCGDKFDVNYHEALATRDIQANENYKPDDIVEIYQSGWLLNGDLVRPTKVVVGK